MSEDIVVYVVEKSDRKNLVLVYRDPVTGKPETRSARTANRRKAEKAAAKWEAELREGRYHRPNRTTWSEFREQCESERLATKSTATIEATATAFNHFERIIDPKYLRSVNSAIVSRFQAALRKEGMGETTIATHLRRLRAVFNWATKIGLLAKAPEFDIHNPQRGQRMMRGRPITLEEFERMLTKIEAGLIAHEKGKRKNEVLKAKPRKRLCDAELRRRRERQAERAAGVAPAWRHLLRGLWLSGLRLGEAAIVSWDADAPFCVDLTGRYPRFRIYAEAQKGRRDEFLPMTPDFAEFLMQTPEDERTGSVFVVRRQKGGVIRYAHQIGPVVSAIGEAAGVVVNKAEGKYASAHDLRWAFGTRWSSRVKPATLQRLMRHRSIETTLAYYVAQDADDIAADLWAGFRQETAGLCSTLCSTEKIAPNSDGPQSTSAQ